MLSILITMLVILGLMLVSSAIYLAVTRFVDWIWSDDGGGPTP